MLAVHVASTIILAAASMLSACESAEEPPHDDAVAQQVVTARVIAPDGGEQLTAAEPVIVQWSGEDSQGGSLLFDVELVDDTRVIQTLATAIELASGQTGELTWAPIGVAAPTPYRIRVTARNAASVMGTDESNATFSVVPPQGISFARDVQPIFTAHCTTKFCHDVASQVAVLNLSAGAAYAELVNVPSRENPCTSYLRVRPQLPASSYLVFKVEGTGPCLYGVRMPKDAAALASAQITAIRSWISAGAPNN